MTKQELADLFIERLNEISKADPVAMEWLLENRTTCTKKLADHPSVQVYAAEDGEPPRVGMLGILNGIVGSIDDGPKKNWGFIAAVWDDNKQFIGFRRTDSPQVTLI